MEVIYFEIVAERNTSAGWELAQMLPEHDAQSRKNGCAGRALLSIPRQADVKPEDEYLVALLAGHDIVMSTKLGKEMRSWGGPIPSVRVSMNDLSPQLLEWAAQCEILSLRAIGAIDFLGFLEFDGFACSEGVRVALNRLGEVVGSIGRLEELRLVFCCYLPRA